MDLEGLQSFILIAREKSISKAARSLHVTQPTLSSRIRKLEEAMGFKLLERNWEGVKLTQKGHYFLLHAIQLIREFSNTSAVLSETSIMQISKALEEVTSSDRYNICLDTGLSNTFIQSIVSALQKSGLNLKYKYMIRPSVSVVDLLEHGVIDVGIFYNNCMSMKIHSVKLMEEEWVLLCSMDTILDPGNHVEGLKKEAFVLFENPVSVYLQLEEIFLCLMGELPERLQLVDNVEMMLGVVANGQGYTIVPKSYVPDFLINKYPVRLIKLNNSIPKIEIHLAYSDHTLFPISLETFASQLLDNKSLILFTS